MQAIILKILMSAVIIAVARVFYDDRYTPVWMDTIVTCITAVVVILGAIAGIVLVWISL